MDSELIKRINELARLKKEKGLTPQQQLEQDRLRKLYLAGIRAQVQAQLDGISIKELLKRPVAEQCSAEEYYICDCRNCNKDCVHRDCFRRLPAAFGGKGLCARLK